MLEAARRWDMVRSTEDGAIARGLIKLILLSISKLFSCSNTVIINLCIELVVFEHCLEALDRRHLGCRSC